MLFWFYMLAMDLLIPVIMIFFGLRFCRSAPKEINFIFGYRTEMSMKNRDTWEFAHRLCGRIWLWTGAISLPLLLTPPFFFLHGDKDTLGTLGSVLIFVGLGLMIAVIPIVEIALRHTFDKDGNRIQK